MILANPASSDQAELVATRPLGTLVRQPYLRRDKSQSHVPNLSIIIPTLNESPNLASLLDRIQAAMGDRTYEVLVVDDGSVDGTQELCAALMVTHPLRLYVRHRPLGGLSGAVIEGFRHARGEVVIVMDGDLQHPPEAICSLIDPVLTGRAELAVGSRSAVGGTTQGHRQPAGRRLTSYVAKMLAWPLTGVVADPMSGFFAVSPAALARAQPLDPVGYKIALELICKCRFSAVTEVPFEFGLRQAGRSKLTTKEYWNYLRHLARLYRHRLRMLAACSTD